MKFPNQAKLIRKTRYSMGLTLGELGASIGVSPAFISKVEKGFSGLAPQRWKLLNKVVGREAALDAYIADMVETWEAEFDK